MKGRRRNNVTLKKRSEKDLFIGKMSNEEKKLENKVNDTSVKNISKRETIEDSVKEMEITTADVELGDLIRNYEPTPEEITAEMIKVTGESAALLLYELVNGLLTPYVLKTARRKEKTSPGKQVSINGSVTKLITYKIVAPLTFYVGVAADVYINYKASEGISRYLLTIPILTNIFSLMYEHTRSSLIKNKTRETLKLNSPDEE